MALAEWSGRRVATIWAVALVAQAAAVVGGAALALRHVRDTAPRELRLAAERDARWRVAEAAEAERLARQRAEGPATRGADGAPRYAVVRTPSGRPSPEAVAAGAARSDRAARWLMALQLGAVPLGLALLTLAWLVARRWGARSHIAPGVP